MDNENIFSYVKNKLSLEEVTLKYTDLKKDGNYLKAACPLCSKQGFTVSPGKQIFYCFNCHTGGDAITLVSKIENIKQYEATLKLADEFNIKITERLKEKNGK